ncbi:hypothetical protein RB594_008475 [Gaeumannomyces avenae]
MAWGRAESHRTGRDHPWCKHNSQNQKSPADNRPHETGKRGIQRTPTRCSQDLVQIGGGPHPYLRTLAIVPGHPKPQGHGGPQNIGKATKPALKALTPAWRTSPVAIRYWNTGFSPQEVWGRELARASNRLHTLPLNHPITYRLRHSEGTPTILSRLYDLTPVTPVPAPRQHPVGPGASATAELFGLEPRPPKKARPKGDPGPRLTQADPVRWWEANRPTSYTHVNWDPKYTWETTPEGRGKLHTFLAEGSGHGNFESYHKRFNHLWTQAWHCVCGVVKEVGHTDNCELRRVPATWRKEPNLAANNTEEAKWWRRGQNAIVRIGIEKALRSMGAEQVMSVNKDGIEVKGQGAGAEDPDDSDAEEELPIAEVGRLA